MLHRRRHCCHWHRHLMRRKRRQSLIGVAAGPLGASLAVPPGHVSLKPSDSYARLVVRRCFEFPGARPDNKFVRILPAGKTSTSCVISFFKLSRDFEILIE